MSNVIQAAILCINDILWQKIKLKIRQNLKILEKTENLRETARIHENHDVWEAYKYLLRLSTMKSL